MALTEQHQKVLRLCVHLSRVGNGLAATIRLGALRDSTRGDQRSALDRELRKHGLLDRVLDDMAFGKMPMAFGRMPGKGQGGRV